MIAIDHRQAPEPSYTIRSSSPRTILSACRASPKAQAKITTVPKTLPATTAVDQSSEISFLSQNSDGRHIAPGIQEITADELFSALERLSRTELPSSSTVFPWFHCIRATNTEQKHFFRVDHETICPTPTTWRGITLVHCTSGRSNEHRLVGSIEPRDILKAQSTNDNTSVFANVDPQWGIHLRNFGLQQYKTAFLSDLVVYRVGDTEADKHCALALCKRLAEAQANFREKQVSGFPKYKTFLVSNDFDKFTLDYPGLVTEQNDPNKAVPESRFLRLEREQMHIFAQASEISQNLYMGDDQDWLEITTNDRSSEIERTSFDIHIRCDDSASVPCVSSDISEDCTSGQIVRVCDFWKFPQTNSAS